MVQRLARSGVIALFGEVRRGEVTLGDDAVRHLRARRAQPGAVIRLADGRGNVGSGVLAQLTKSGASVSIEVVESVSRPATLEVVVPVADRERMLMAAEKCVELQITAWRPVNFARSASVSPRGEGPRFRDKLLARMQGALEQSGGAWLPELHVEAAFETVLGSAGSVKRVLLDRDGEPLGALAGDVTALAVGPEGGLEPGELQAAQAGGWEIASLGSSTLRFETAIVAGVAIVRAAQLASGGNPNG